MSILKASFSFLIAILALLLLELKTGCALLNVNHTSSISRDDISTPATRCATWDTLLDRLGVNREVEARKSHTRWNILHHLGGNGPWIKMSEDDEAAQSVLPPLGCFIDQVHMISRHAERYPTPSVGRRHLSFLERARNLKSPFNSSLEFLNNWTYFTDNPERDFGQLTTTGPYAGTLTAFTTGVQFRTRYKDLLGLGSSIRFWASDSQRVIDSARHFAAGLFGLDWETRGAVELEIIPETFERGANTLTPGDTCRRYLEDSDHGHENGYTMLGKYQDLYTPGIAQRLVSENPSLGNLSSTEIYGMQEMCGFEIMVRGHSPWCSVFTEDDWSHFEYARDIKHYYGSGPGNPYGGAMGWLWLNATAELLQAGPEAGSLFFSFVHDGDLSPLLAALNLFDDPIHAPLPLENIPRNRQWKTSRILPMGARLSLERMSCPRENGRDDSDEVYIRINMNDKILQSPGCKAGPGLSCSLREFADYIHTRENMVGKFDDVCGLEGRPERISFLRQQDKS